MQEYKETNKTQVFAVQTKRIKDKIGAMIQCAIMTDSYQPTESDLEVIGYKNIQRVFNHILSVFSKFKEADHGNLSADHFKVPLVQEIALKNEFVLIVTARMSKQSVELKVKRPDNLLVDIGTLYNPSAKAKRERKRESTSLSSPNDAKPVEGKKKKVVSALGPVRETEVEVEESPVHR